MSKTMAICKKEIKSYFLSPIAYVLIGIFLLLLGFFGGGLTLTSQEATMDSIFGFIIWIFLILCPILTMKLMSEEKKTGTEQLLLTSPIRLRDIVLGKYLGALVVYGIMLLITFIYPIILYYYAKIDLGPVFTGYLGVLLVGAAFISVGIFASSLTENQIIAGVVSFAMLFIIALIQSLTNYLQGTTGIVRDVIEFISTINRFTTNFLVGIINLSDILYFISFIFIFLFLTVRLMEKRRWGKE